MLPVRPMRFQISCVVVGNAGLAKIVMMRSASSASPITVFTASPGSIFHGSLSSRYELVAPISFHVASSALLGCTAAHACDVSATAVAAISASGLLADDAGPTPPHFFSTTVATRAAKLPRLFARSLLKRLIKPSSLKSPSLPYVVSANT